MIQMIKYEKDWITYYDEVSKLINENIITKYHSDFKELWERGTTPQRSVIIVFKLIVANKK